MECLGFSKDVILWFKSYLSNKKFKLNLKKTFSEFGKRYINYMAQAVKCEFLLSADDTCLIFQHNNIKEIEIGLNKKFSLICDWFVSNKLSIHFRDA